MWTHYFSWSGRTGTNYTKIVLGHVTSIFSFCIWWDLHVTWCVPVHPGYETSTRYFSCSSETSMDLTKSALEHVTLNFSFCIHKH
jgi:hypothetical protein